MAICAFSRERGMLNADANRLLLELSGSRVSLFGLALGARQAGACVYQTDEQELCQYSESRTRACI